MYRCYVDNTLFHEPGVENCQITAGTIDKEVNLPDVLKMTVPRSNWASDIFSKRQNIIEVRDDDELLFRGLVMDINTDFYNNIVIEAEGELGYLNDSIYRPFNFTGSIAEFLQNILISHNQQVDEYKKIYLGNVTVTDPNNYITRSSIEALSTREVINSRLLDLLKGYLMIRRVNGVNYLDYLADSPYITTQEIKIGQNMLDFNRKTSGRKMITGIVAYGSRLKNDEGEDTDERLTVASVNNGKDYVLDEDAAAQYGKIFAVRTWDDVTLPSNLLRKANETLATETVFENVTSVRAIDLNLVDEDIQKLKFFHNVKVISEYHGYSKTDLIRKITLDLISPQNNTISLEGTSSTLTEEKRKADKVVEQIKADYVPNKKLNEVKTRVTEVESEIVQLPSKIGLVVEEKTYTKEEIENKLAEVEPVPVIYENMLPFDKRTFRNWVALEGANIKVSDCPEDVWKDEYNRNLALDSNPNRETTDFLFATFNMVEEWDVSTAYTLTIKGTTMPDGEFALYQNDGMYNQGYFPVNQNGIASIAFVPTQPTPDNEKKFQICCTSPNGIGTQKIEWIKLEKGLFPTDYCKAWEELPQEELTSQYVEIKGGTNIIKMITTVLTVAANKEKLNGFNFTRKIKVKNIGTNDFLLHGNSMAAPVGTNIETIPADNKVHELAKSFKISKNNSGNLQMQIRALSANHTLKFYAKNPAIGYTADINDTLDRFEKSSKAAIEVQKNRVDILTQDLIATNDTAINAFAKTTYLDGEITSIAGQYKSYTDSQIEQKTMSIVQQAKDEVKTSFINEIEEKLETAEGTITNLKKIETYYRQTPEMAIIGKSDSQMQLTLSNEKIEFVEAGVPVVTINAANRKMTIENAEIAETIKMAYHIWETYDSDAHGKTTIMKFVG